MRRAIMRVSPNRGVDTRAGEIECKAFAHALIDAQDRGIAPYILGADEGVSDHPAAISLRFTRAHTQPMNADVRFPFCTFHEHLHTRAHHVIVKRTRPYISSPLYPLLALAATESLAQAQRIRYARGHGILHWVKHSKMYVYTVHGHAIMACTTQRCVCTPGDARSWRNRIQCFREKYVG